MDHARWRSLVILMLLRSERTLQYTERKRDDTCMQRKTFILRYWNYTTSNKYGWNIFLNVNCRQLFPSVAEIPADIRFKFKHELSCFPTFTILLHTRRLLSLQHVNICVLSRNEAIAASAVTVIESTPTVVARTVAPSLNILLLRHRRFRWN